MKQCTECSLCKKWQQPLQRRNSRFCFGSSDQLVKWSRSVVSDPLERKYAAASNVHIYTHTRTQNCTCMKLRLKLWSGRTPPSSCRSAVHRTVEVGDVVGDTQEVRQSAGVQLRTRHDCRRFLRLAHNDTERKEYEYLDIPPSRARPFMKLLHK